MNLDFGQTGWWRRAIGQTQEGEGGFGYRMRQRFQEAHTQRATAPSRMSAKLTPAITFLRFTVASAAHSARGASGTPSRADGAYLLAGSEDARSDGEAL